LPKDDIEAMVVTGDKLAEEDIKAWKGDTPLPLPGILRAHGRAETGVKGNFACFHNWRTAALLAFAARYSRARALAAFADETGGVVCTSKIIMHMHSVTVFLQAVSSVVSALLLAD
jgi:hypothetical protein